MASTYIAAVINSAVAANKYHLGLFVGSQLPLVAVDVSFVVINSHLTVANAGTGTSFTLKRTTASGTGTAVTLRKYNSKDPVCPPSVTSLSNITTPTEDTTPELAGCALYTEEAIAQNPQAVLFRADSRSQPITLNPGQGLVIQQSALSSAGAVNVFIHFTVRRLR